jgi:hypothetical protein
MTAMPRATWTRLARRLGFDGNPLRRRSDLAERWLLPAAIALFVALCPLVAGLTSMWVRTENAAVEHAKLDWHPVTAVLLEAVPGPAESANGANSWVTWTRARWTLDGRQHIGDVPAAAKSSAGSTETIYLNHAGQVQMPPLTSGQVGGQAAADTLIALTILAAVLAGLRWVALASLRRRRLAGWETAWLTVGPLWSRQG